MTRYFVVTDEDLERLGLTEKDTRGRLFDFYFCKDILIDLKEQEEIKLEISDEDFDYAIEKFEKYVNYPRETTYEDAMNLVKEMFTETTVEE
jgi:hypothetical protein